MISYDAFDQVGRLGLLSQSHTHPFKMNGWLLVWSFWLVIWFISFHWNQPKSYLAYLVSPVSHVRLKNSSAASQLNSSSLRVLIRVLRIPSQVSWSLFSHNDRFPPMNWEIGPGQYLGVDELPEIAVFFYTLNSVLHVIRRVLFSRLRVFRQPAWSKMSSNSDFPEYLSINGNTSDPMSLFLFHMYSPGELLPHKRNAHSLRHPHGIYIHIVIAKWTNDSPDKYREKIQKGELLFISR